ncbi:hypothetical protein L195_g029338 [Trifolium pratense]|uniref:Uncharacterized protein n=1 Tax=Trifolium pratense TaxID=57577 RepID=A0A2K3L4H6_TRIPR|nr:hypothetical protein L195_g029338 [Trifolium pratense]
MDQDNNIPCAFSSMNPTSGVTLGVIGSTSVDKQVEVWDAARANFGLNSDQNMDPKKARRLLTKSQFQP